jgi:hypothetical protein
MIEKIQERRKNVILCRLRRQQLLGVAERQNTLCTSERQKGDKNLGWSARRIAINAMNGAWRERQACVYPKARNLLQRARCPSGHQPLRVNALQQAHGLEEIEIVAAVEKESL